MIHKPATTLQPIHELLAQRWSGRGYRPDRPITQDEKLALVEAARWSPSCANDQPWRYILWDRFRDEANWHRAFDCLNKGNRAWVVDTSLLIVSCADSEFSARPGRHNRFGPYDTGAASMAICLQATALGLMAHQMGGFDPDRLRSEFDIPERYSIMAMIAVGVPVDSESDLRTEIRDRELAPRTRRQARESFFDGTWGHPLQPTERAPMDAETV
jgi:nitroreductase